MIEPLLEDHERIVEQLYEIASDLHTEPDVLRQLSIVTDSYILNAVLCNPNTPNDVFNRALREYCGVGGNDDEIRIHIACNSGLEINDLKRIVDEDLSTEVREAALTAYIKRITMDSDATHKKISELYDYAMNTITDKNRLSIAIESLKKHPHFK